MRDAVTEIFFAQRARLFCWLPLWLAVGIGMYFSLPFEPGFALLMAASAVVAISLPVAFVWQSIWRALFWVPLLIALGFLVANGRSNLVASPKLGWYFYGAVEGTVAKLDRSGSDRPRVTLIDPVLAGIAPKDTPAVVRVSLHSSLKGTQMRPGARVMITASLSPPAGPVEPGGFDFQRKAWFQRLGAVGYSRIPAMLAYPADNKSLSLRLFALRMKLSNAIRKAISGQPGAFAAAIVTGDRSALDPTMLTALRQSNLAHLLAISGLHMGLLTGFIFALIRYSLALVPYLALRLPAKKIAAVVALVAGFAYLGVSGASIATQRAFVMVMVMLVAVLVDQPAITLRAVAFAATLIFLARPESLFEPGFQMSFAATTALVATFEALKRNSLWAKLQQGRARWLRPVLAVVVSSGVAGLATAPISAFHFNQIAQYGLLANLASVPVMGFLVMPAAVIAGLLSLIGLEGPAFYVMGQGIDWILTVAQTVAGLGGAVTRIPSVPSGVLAVLAFAMIFLVLWRGRLRFLGLVPVGMAFVFWAQFQRPDILISDTGRLVGIKIADKRALNRSKGSGFAARSWLENDGDAADQMLAAKRLALNDDDWVIDVGGQMVGYIWPKKTAISAFQSRCAQVDVLIAPNLAVPVSGGCRVLSKDLFKRFGAISLREKSGVLQMQNTRTWQGARLWNQ